MIDSKSHYGGAKVDLSISETRELLAKAPIRIREGGKTPFIRINGEWWRVCRTDLLNDVCTIVTQKLPKVRELRKLEIALVKYGARLQRHNGKRFFAIVDSLSDG